MEIHKENIEDLTPDIICKEVLLALDRILPSRIFVNKPCICLNEKNSARNYYKGRIVDVMVERPVSSNLVQLCIAYDGSKVCENIPVLDMKLSLEQFYYQHLKLMIEKLHSVRSER